MSSTLGLVDVSCQPSSKDKVQTLCVNCNTVRTITYSELIRSANNRIKYSELSLCPACVRKLPAFKSAMSDSSKSVIDKITKGASERSKSLWQDPEYRAARLSDLAKLTNDAEFANKVSDSIKNKFRNDADYRSKIKEARKKYWDNAEYRSSRTLSQSEFIRQAISVHGNKYDYTNINYLNFAHKINIRCKVHGDFVQYPGHHLYLKNGCPQCSFNKTTSSAENEIASFISNLGVNIIRNDRSMLNGAEIDIYIPDYKLGIEHHGLYWHTYDKVENGPQRYRHHYKSTLANRNNIKLLQFTDIEYLRHRYIVESMIKHRLRVSTTYGARCCTISEFDEDTSARFFNDNHLQGHRPAKYYFGLVYDNTIMSMISISHCTHTGGYELIRFASKCGYAISGGLSKLISHIIKKGFNNIFTYADRRYSDANGYITVGFELLGITPPGYKYFKNGELYSRHQFQKHKLSTKLCNYSDDLSEAENMFNNGYRRFWDAGHFRLRLNRS